MTATNIIASYLARQGKTRKTLAKMAGVKYPTLVWQLAHPDSMTLRQVRFYYNILGVPDYDRVGLGQDDHE